MKRKLAEIWREQMLDAWSKVVLSIKDVPPPAAAAKAPTVGYDVELKRMRLEFEMKKFDSEARWKEEREREDARRREELEIARLREEREEARWKEEKELKKIA
jgi:hypothetical protein